MKETKKKSGIRHYVIIGGIIVIAVIVGIVLFGKQTIQKKEDAEDAVEEILEEASEENEEEVIDYKAKTEFEESQVSTLETAEGYLGELEFEEAEKYFLMAIEEEPKQMERYVKLAELYMELGDTKKAEEALQSGENQGAEGTEEDVIRIRKTITDSAGYLKAYAAKVHECEKEYGKSEIVKYSEEDSCMKGLSFMKLIDFDQNGKEELLLVYSTFLYEEDGRTYNYDFQIWGYENKKAVLLDSGKVYASDGGWTPVILLRENGDYYLVINSPESSEESFCHGYGEDGFGIVEKNEWKGNSVWYSLNSNVDNCEHIVKQNEATMLRMKSYY